MPKPQPSHASSRARGESRHRAPTEPLFQPLLRDAASPVEQVPKAHLDHDDHRRSVAVSRILLLEELQNWRHSLTSLERMRRYAGELGFDVPASEEARIWTIYDAQLPEMRRGMVERFHATARHDQGVAEEIAWRP